MITYKKLNEKQKYSRWYNMNSRCYRESYHRSHSNEIYPLCDVCEEWRANKESFYKWLDENYYTVSTGEQMDVDKDIKVNRNRLYSPDNCLIVPHTINNLWSHLSINYPTFNESKKMWEIGTGFYPDPYGEKKYFDDLDEARAFSAGVKYTHIKEVAEIYRDEIPEKVYQAMLAYKVEPEDWEAWQAA